MAALAAKTIAIPTKETVGFCMNTHIKAYEQQLLALRSARIGFDNTQKQDIVDEILTNLAAIDKKISFEELRKQLGKNLALMRPSDDLLPFGNKLHSLMRKIAFIVLSEIEAIEDDNLRAIYVTGKRKHYTLRTYTSSLCAALNGSSERGKGSFRGPVGYYAQMLACGFLNDKYNRAILTNDRNELGEEVRLEVNLEWIFGFSLTKNLTVVQTENTEKGVFFSEGGRSNSTQLSSLLEKDTKNKESMAKIRDFQHFEAFPTPNSSEKGETSLAPSEFSPDLSAEIKIFAKKAVECLNKEILTAKLVENGRLRYRKDRIFADYNPQNPSDIVSQIAMCEQVIRSNRRENESIEQTYSRIEAAILRGSAYWKMHPQRYVYAPLKWLDTTLLQGGLQAILNQDSEPNSPEKPKKLVVGSISDQYTKILLERGANHSRLSRMQRKKGKELVEYVAKSAYFKELRGFKTQNADGYVAYVFGIMERISLEDAKAEAVVQETLYDEKVSFAREKAMKNAEKSVSATKIWAIARKEFKGKNFTSEQVNEVVTLCKAYISKHNKVPADNQIYTYLNKFK